MRNVTLLNDVDASRQQISAEINMDQRTEWKVYINTARLDGVPRLFIEDNTSPSKNETPTGDWNPICNTCSDIDYFTLDDTVITIEKKDFKANWFRIRIEPNDNTTGTINVSLSYKTFP